MFYTPGWPDEIKVYTKLLQLLPSPPDPTITDTRDDAVEAIEKFITFTDVSIEII